MQPAITRAQQVLGQYYAGHNWGNLICTPLAVEAVAQFVGHFAAGVFCKISANFTESAYRADQRDERANEYFATTESAYRADQRDERANVYFATTESAYRADQRDKRANEYFATAGINIIDSAIFAFGALTPAGGVIVPIAMVAVDMAADEDEGFSDQYYVAGLGKKLVGATLGNRVVSPLTVTAAGMYGGTAVRIKQCLRCSEDVAFLATVALVTGAVLYGTGIGSLSLSAMFTVKVL